MMIAPSDVPTAIPAIAAELNILDSLLTGLGVGEMLATVGWEVVKDNLSEIILLDNVVLK